MTKKVCICEFLQSESMNSRLLSLILLLHIQGFLTLDNFTVICNKRNICVVRGDFETLRCFYSNINIKTGFWFSQKQRTNWRTKNEPEDLTLDSDYSGRVNQRITNYQSELTITDLRERDSGEYQLMFIMKDGVKHISSVTVSLTVTALQVKRNPESTELRNQYIELICDSSCTLTSGNYYYWYKNRQYFRYGRSIFVSSSSNTDSYFCSKYEKKNPSSPVCISNSSCWDVIYTFRRVCALVGSTVDIHSTYSHPTGYTVEKTFWHLIGSEGFVDLREDQQFAGRVEYVGNTLRIKDVKMSDSGEYRFRFITNTSDGKFSGSPGVTLTVTETQVISSPDPVIEGEKVILSCSTKCTLDNKYTYIWYKNGQKVTDGFTLLNKLYLESVSSEELQEYSCDVRDLDKSTWLRNTAIILSVPLTLALIGVLSYRIRRSTLSKNHEDAKEEAQYESVYHDVASSQLKQKEDSDDQTIHYSTLNFGHSKSKHTSSDATVCATDITKEDVHYATVIFS